MEISQENEQFLQSAIANGEFASRGEALDRAVQMLRERQAAIDRIRARPQHLPALPQSLEQLADGYIQVRGHRVGLHLILESLFGGADQAEIQDRFSSVPHEALDEIRALAAEHPVALQSYLEQQRAISRLLVDDNRRGPAVEELRARWQTKPGKPAARPCP